MSCLPESGGCERWGTDPFVHHLNDLEATHFSHQMCLDRKFRNTPQPEALYVDAYSSQRLVIERKTLVWPRDYVIRHENDHFVADILLDGLRNLTNNAPYAIILESALIGGHHELAEFGRQITQSVQRRFSHVAGGRVIGSDKPGRRWKVFLEDPAARMDEEPSKGLIIRWYPETPFDFTSTPPQELLEDLKRIFESCCRKFRGYLEARRILLIDPHGELQGMNLFWLPHLLKSLPPPNEVSEIWVSISDWIDKREREWTFERLFPETPFLAEYTA